jgi:hypothetical protein
LKISAGSTITFEAWTTTTVSSFTATGTSGNLITLGVAYKMTNNLLKAPRKKSKCKKRI